MQTNDKRPVQSLTVGFMYSKCMMQYYIIIIQYANEPGKGLLPVKTNLLLYHDCKDISAIIQ